MASCITSPSLSHPALSRRISALGPEFITQLAKNMSQFFSQSSRVLAAINEEIVKSNRSLDSMALESEKMELISNAEEKIFTELKKKLVTDEGGLESEVKLFNDDEEDMKGSGEKHLKIPKPFMHALKKKLRQLFPGVDFTQKEVQQEPPQYYIYPSKCNTQCPSPQHDYDDRYEMKEKKYFWNRNQPNEQSNLGTQGPVNFKFAYGGMCDECTECPVPCAKSTIYIIIEAPPLYPTQFTTCSWICDTVRGDRRMEGMCTCSGKKTKTTKSKKNKDITTTTTMASDESEEVAETDEDDVNGTTTETGGETMKTTAEKLSKGVKTKATTTKPSN